MIRTRLVFLLVSLLLLTVVTTVMLLSATVETLVLYQAF